MVVDPLACERLATLLARQQIPIDEEDSHLEGFSREEAGNYYLLLVAICHQTSPRGRLPLEGTVGGQRRKGWDYLSAKLEGAVRAERSLFYPNVWSHLSVEEFLALFRDREVGDRISEPERRVQLVQNLGQVMRDRRWRWLQEVYELAEGRVASGVPNLFGLLSNFEAYRDPVKKKSSFLLSLMRNGGLWTYVDNELLGPPVDYHEVRGHLRIGTVVVQDSELRHKLLTGVRVSAEEDVALREAVYQAIMLLSKLTGLNNPSQLHYLFWNIFRSCCLRESPHCKQCDSACSLPERYVPLALDSTGNRHCPFASVCESASIEHRYYEHNFETDYY